MKNTVSTRFRLWDGVVMAAVLLAALCLFLVPLLRGGGKTAIVRVDGEIVARMPLSRDDELHVENNGYHLTVTVRDGAVFISETDCPDRVCEHTGKISKKGAAIVCAPAGVTVTIGKGGNDDADFVAG